MWYIYYNDGADRVDLEPGDVNILYYAGQTIHCEGEESLADGTHVINDAFLLAYDWFEDTEDWDIIHAYRKNMGCSIQEAFDKWEEAYQGEYDSDADFAESFAEELGLIDRSVTWPMNCIDWEDAAKELMYDYFESDGYYFRSL